MIFLELRDEFNVYDSNIKSGRALTLQWKYKQKVRVTNQL
jgi:hypothetical protein